MRSILLAAALTLIGCGTGTGDYVSALTGQTCEPNKTHQPKKPASNDKCQGTSNGDNCDDLSSGKIDCIGDGNSGQGDDKKHNCQFPQPGCDDQGCCDEDVVEPPGGDDGDDGGGDPPPPPPPDDSQPPPDGEGEPPPPPPSDDGPIL